MSRSKLPCLARYECESHTPHFVERIHMTKLLALLLASLALAGCVSTPIMRLPTSDLSDRSDVTIVDRSKSGAIEISAFTYGNIYSCHYGTMKVDGDKITPAPVEYMRTYLSSKLASPARIDVERFDIYTNSKARFLKSLAGTKISPYAGSMVTFGRYEPTGETIVGCKGADAGEYAYGEVNASVVPILIYLNGAFDGKPFRLRTISDANTQGVYPSPNDLKTAIDMTLDALTQRLAADAMTK